MHWHHLQGLSWSFLGLSFFCFYWFPVSLSLASLSRSFFLTPGPLHMLHTVHLKYFCPGAKHSEIFLVTLISIQIAFSNHLLWGFLQSLWVIIYLIALVHFLQNTYHYVQQPSCLCLDKSQLFWTFSLIYKPKKLDNDFFSSFGLWNLINLLAKTLPKINK